MITDEKIQNVFECYNVKSKLARVYDNWAVSADGDIINIKYLYPIYSYQLKDGYDSWNNHLQEKTWYDASAEDSFKQAYELALRVIRK